MTTSGTHNFAFGLLILLQLPLLLRLTICGFTLHYWLFIEIQLNEFTPVKVDKIVNPVNNTFLTNANIFISYYSFLLNAYECLKYHQLQ